MKQVVLVTGASRGIGKEVALEFGRSGFDVILHYNKEREKALSVAAEIEKAGAKCCCMQADVSDCDSVSHMIAGALDKKGRIDVLVHNAAITRDRTIMRMSQQEWHDVISTDLNGSFYILQECGKAMFNQRKGSVITIASIAALRGTFGGANYSAAKAGLITLTKSFAREFGRFSVTANTVLPGFHETDMSKNLPQSYKDRVAADSVLSKTTDIHELAKFIVFLSQVKTVSGQVFNWDSRII